MYRALISICLWLSLLATSLSLIGQEGHAFGQHFPYETYHSEPFLSGAQNFSLVQDSLGYIFVGNANNILVFDGKHWRAVAGAANKRLSKLCIGPEGSVFAAGMEDMGFIEVDEQANWRFVSLKAKLGAGFEGIRFVEATENEVFFQARNAIFRWDGTEFEREEGKFLKLMQVDKALWLQETNQGMLVWQSHAWKKLPFADQFVGHDIKAVVPLGEQQYLAVDRRLGIFAYDKQEGKRLAWPKINAHLSQTQLYNAAGLSTGEVALATPDQGVVVIDPRQDSWQSLGDPADFPSQKALNLKRDRENGLWVCWDNGLSRFEYPAPFWHWPLKGRINQIAPLSNDLYIASSEGLKRLDASGKLQNLINGNTIWDLATIGDQLWIAQQAGVQIWEGPLLPLPRLRTILPSLNSADRVWLGSEEGLFLASRQDHQWQISGPVGEITHAVRSLAEMPDGSIWAADTKLSRLSSEGEVLEIDSLKGLHPDMRNLSLAVWKGQLMVGTSQGLFSWDLSEERLQMDSVWQQQFGQDQREAYALKVDPAGGLWVASHLYQGYFDQNGWDFSSMARLPETECGVFYPDNNGNLWIGSSKGLFRYRASLLELPKALAAFGPQLKQGDSLLYGGATVLPQLLAIPYRDRDVSFHFAAPFYHAPERNWYRYRLIGYQNDWSAWTQQNQKEYTSLFEGTYTLELQARSVYWQESEISQYSFRILPPWYRSIWAYLVYGLLVLALLYAAYRAIVRNEARKAKLRIELLEAKQIKELDQIKSRFFANISHEFRTPLTLILGPLRRMIKGEIDSPDSYYQLMYRNADRLLNLINQLLDLSKLESDKMELVLTHGDLWQFGRDLLSSFVPLAEEKKLQYLTHVPETTFWTDFDRDKLEKIISNLLSNALKYSPLGGSLSVRLGRDPQQAHSLLIEVSDQGPGLTETQQAQVFDRFYQVEGSEEQGTGIGLALVHELVNRLNGQISLESQWGQGTTFRVRLPLLASGVSMEIKPSPIQDTENSPEEKPIVLIVEDHEEMMAYIIDCLGDKYDFLQAHNGSAGLAKAIKHIPDLVISDVMMPEMDGFAFTHQLKTQENTGHIPVILLTAKAGQHNKIVGLETGADAFISKPFDPTELELQVSNLLIQRQKMRQRFGRKVDLRPSEIAVTSADERFLKRVMRVIEAQMANEHFSIVEMGEEVGMSRSQLHRKLKALTDQSPSVFLRSMRLKRSQDLLRQKAGTASEIAYTVGFGSPAYFNKCYKEQFGITPGEEIAQSNQSK